MRRRLLIAAMAALNAVTFALPARAGNGEAVGTVLGAGLGGLIGNQFGHGGGKVALTATGVVLGGYAGNSIGASYDYDNRPSYAAATTPYYSYPAATAYQNEYVPNYVAPPAVVQPEDPATYDASVNAYCREYTQQITVAGQVQESYGTACLQPDGSWRVVP